MTESVAPSASMSSPRTAICFLCDERYLFPTLVCAEQARMNAHADADVIIFTDAPVLHDANRKAVERICGVSIRTVPQDIVARIDAVVPDGFFARTHLNKSSLFRLFLADLLGPSYARVLYLDGDMQVTGSLAPLLETRLAAGQIAAVRDWIGLHTDPSLPTSQHMRAYTAQLGLTPTQAARYFNAGMILGSFDTWAERGAEAMAFLAAHPERCKRHDQSALNYVCRDHLKPMSMRWNFLRSYMELPAYKAIAPRIHHYVGRPKPWDGVFPPWGPEAFAPYRSLAQRLDGLGVQWIRQPLTRRIAYYGRGIFATREFTDPAYAARVNAILMDEMAVA